MKWRVKSEGWSGRRHISRLFYCVNLEHTPVLSGHKSSCVNDTLTNIKDVEITFTCKMVR